MSVPSHDKPTLELSARGPTAAKQDPNELEAFLALSITCVDDPTGPEIFDDGVNDSPEMTECSTNKNYDETTSAVESGTASHASDGTSSAALDGSEKPALFAPGATLRRQRHRRAVTKDWKDFISTIVQKEDGSFLVPEMKQGVALPSMCNTCGAELEEDEPQC